MESQCAAMGVERSGGLHFEYCLDNMGEHEA
jgi:hypothetical protein